MKNSGRLCFNWLIKDISHRTKIFNDPVKYKTYYDSPLDAVAVGHDLGVSFLDGVLIHGSGHVVLKHQDCENHESVIIW